MDSFSVGIYFSGYKKRREELVLDHIHPGNKLTVTWWTSPFRLLGPFTHLNNRQYTLLRANWEDEICQVLEIPT